jgi:archaellum component FlaC
MNKQLTPEELNTEPIQYTQRKIPIIEGLDTNEEKVITYTNTNDVVPQNLSYLKCVGSNEKQCTNIKNALHEQQLLLNKLGDVRNQTKINFETCDTKLKGCEMLYNDITDKTNEFKKIWNEINILRQNLKNCALDKEKCDNVEKEVHKLEQIISQNEKSLENVKGSIKRSRC